MAMPEPPTPAPDAEPTAPGRRSRWAEQELGQLLSRAWTDPPAPEPAPPAVPDGEIPSWEVERMPSEEEGGVVSLLLEDRGRPRDDPAGQAPWVGRPDAKVTGLARLTEMLEQLPTEPVARVTPEDVAVDAPVLAPPAVWFWGDDDIYPGKVPGVPDGEHGRVKPLPVKRSWRAPSRGKRARG